MTAPTAGWTTAPTDRVARARWTAAPFGSHDCTKRAGTDRTDRTDRATESAPTAPSAVGRPPRTRPWLREPGAIALALGVVALGLAIYEVVHVQTRIDHLEHGSNGVAIAITIGVGLWVVVAGALAVVASGGWAFGASRQTAVE